jgi:hypothetical protein
MEGPYEEVEAFNPMESAINGSRNMLSGTGTTTFTRFETARLTEPWYFQFHPPQLRVPVPAKRKRSTGQIGLQLPWYLTSSRPPPQDEDEGIPAIKKFVA